MGFWINELREEADWYKNQQTTTYDFDNISYQNKNLSFVYKRFATKYKPTRYKTINYEHIPTNFVEYTTEKIIFKKSMHVSDIKSYLENNFSLIVVKYAVDINAIKKFCEYFAYIPSWIDDYANLSDLNAKKLDFEIEKEKIEVPIEYPTDYPEIPGNFWLRLLFAPFTLFLSFIGYISKSTACKNSEINAENRALNEKNQIEYENKLNKLRNNIEEYNNKIDEEVRSIFNNKIVHKFNENTSEWLDLRKILKPKYLLDDLKSKKGVYIIWNKTKNKFYVGQTKDLYKRIFMEHFNRKKEIPHNSIFVMDWNNNDQFYVRWEIIKTKDELDMKEKEYIQKYNSFINGYNSTSGNK